MIRLNAVLAVLLGIALAIGESIRRFGTEFWFPFVVDDYLMCAFLTLGAWRAYRSAYADLTLLLAGWAFSCGMLYLSFFSNLERYMASSPDSGISSPLWIVLISMAFATSIVGTSHTLRAMRVGK